MRFLAMFIFFMLGSLTLWIVLIWGQAGNPTKMSQWIYDAYEKKEGIARSIKEEKVVIVAGSNALFGIDSKMLSKAMGLPVINYGVNAGIELPLTLFMAQKVIHKGDTVIMPLEYPMYSYDGTAGAQMIDYLFAREPAYFWRLRFQEKLYLVWHTTFGRIAEGYFRQENTPVTKGLYGAHHIDDYGDQIETEIKHRSNWMYNEVLNHVKNPQSYGVEFDREALGWFYLEEFVQWCNTREVKVIFMPSTLLKNERYMKDPKEKWLYTHIADEVRRKGWNYVGNPYDYMYETELYFNTDFHLIDSARKMRTEKMLEDLGCNQGALKCTLR